MLIQAYYNEENWTIRTYFHRPLCMYYPFKYSLVPGSHPVHMHKIYYIIIPIRFINAYNNLLCFFCFYFKYKIK